MGSTLYFTLRYPMLFNTIAVVLAYLSWGSWQTQLVSTVVAIAKNNSERLTTQSAEVSGYMSHIRGPARLTNMVLHIAVVAS